MGYKNSSFWPAVKKEYIENNKIDYVVQINGKKRSVINADKDLRQEILFDLVKKDKLLDKYLKDLSVKKIIFVENRLMNILV